VDLGILLTYTTPCLRRNSNPPPWLKVRHPNHSATTLHVLLPLYELTNEWWCLSRLDQRERSHSCYLTDAWWRLSLPFCLHRQSAYACMFRLCTRLQFVARVNYSYSFASHVLIGCRRRSRDRMSLKIPRDYHGNHALFLEAFWLVTCQVAVKMWIQTFQTFQTSLACRNNHSRNGVRLRK
jgi:hypothetical protein